MTLDEHKTNDITFGLADSVLCQIPCSSLVVAIPYTLWRVVVHSCRMAVGVGALIQEISCDQECNDTDSSQKGRIWG